MVTTVTTVTTLCCSELTALSCGLCVEGMVRAVLRAALLRAVCCCVLVVPGGGCARGAPAARQQAEPRACGVTAYWHGFVRAGVRVLWIVLLSFVDLDSRQRSEC